jgi:hypothetical protein
MKSLLLAAIPVAVAWLVVPQVQAGARNDPGLAAYQKFNSGPPTVPPAPVEKPKPKAPDADLKAQETAAAIRAQEEATFLRRMAVCDRLKQLALELGDTKMEEEALRLELRAGEVFRERTKNLPVSKSAKTKSGE